MNRGFTLVELLAVIVILAVLALIATPVVLSIIDDTKESAMLRSAEMYLSGVENAVMRENMNSGGNFRPNECTITSEGNLDCEGKDGIIEVEVNGEKPKNGSIVFENGKIKEVTLTYQSGMIIKDPNGNLVYEGAGEGSNEEILAPGLYKPNGTFVSWEELTNPEYKSFTHVPGLEAGEKITTGILYIDENGYLYTACDDIYNDVNNSAEFLYGKLVLSDSVIGLGDGAFFNCSNLTEIVFTENIEHFGYQSFVGCTSITKISIPSKITSIDYYTFNYMNNLTILEIPNTLTKIEESSFTGGSSLNTINYLGTKSEWNSIILEENWNAFLGEITVHCTDGDIIIPAYSE